MTAALSCYSVPMEGFTELERAALQSILSETPELAADLERHLESAAVAQRENTGAGFFTTIAVSDNAPRVSGPTELGGETHARVDGLEHGLGFVLFMEGGRLHLLEGYTYAPESTASLDLANLAFEVFKAPLNRRA